MVRRKQGGFGGAWQGILVVLPVGIPRRCSLAEISFKPPITPFKYLILVDSTQSLIPQLLPIKINEGMPPRLPSWLKLVDRHATQGF